MNESDGTMEPDELAMLEALAAMGGADPPPAELVEAGRAIWAWRTVDAELAELAFDSEDDDELVGVRGAGDLRQLTFEAGERSVRVEVTPGPPVRLTGQLTPPSPATVEVRTLAGTTMVEADDHGRFQVAGIGPGAVSLRCTPGGGPAGAVATAWVVI